jgi:RimJ/RimL family protein N-acetyltransferase
MKLRFQHDHAEISLRPATQGDFNFAFEVKCDAMRAHIEAKWLWDESFQLALHTTRWGEKPWFIIERDAQPIGTVSLHWLPTHLRFGEFYLPAKVRGRGIGNQVLTAVLQEANLRALETRLEVLKWNPARSLYERHGFEIVSENEIHFFMVRTQKKFEGTA